MTRLNDLAALSDQVVMVLDDYHVIEDPHIRDGMIYLVEHLPPPIRLVIASRADPALSLARLRARGELVEIRANDLRFTLDEAASYLHEVMGLELTTADVAALEGRTEGWIAALQLAALSTQGRADVAGFIAGFAGDDRYIVDYLVGEVLQRQSQHVRRFLLHTSILSRLNGSLCDAVTGQHDGGAMLDALDRANLFLVPLDDRRLWYRYHHLFADMLRARLFDEQPDEVDDCTGVRATGTPATATSRRPSATPWTAKTSSEPPTSSRWRQCPPSELDRGHVPPVAGGASRETVPGLVWDDPSIAAGLARRLAEEVAAMEPNRLRRCARSECPLIFYDTTRSRTQRWHAEDPCGWRERQHHRRARS
ncbi:MAG: CGNR zinc finger domain-containing protein [Actinomycetota bacterium]|nr:CGNR zinc finger domain-containing protein [Actinomycetota bacterium]